MALNTSDKNGGLLLYNGEMILLFVKKLKMSVKPNVKNPAFDGVKEGQLFLTSHRIVFLNLDKKNSLRSFSIPFCCMDKCELEQPVFGANYISGHVMAQPNGNWDGVATFKFEFTTGGCINFGHALLNVAQLVARKGKMPPPPYEPPPPPYNISNPGSYVAPPGANYGFNMPTNEYPPNDINEPILTTNAPPPYPGIYPNIPSAPPAGFMNAGGNVQPGYYDPNNPHTVYTPTTQAGIVDGTKQEAPPPYTEKEKKN